MGRREVKRQGKERSGIEMRRVKGNRRGSHLNQERTIRVKTKGI